MSYGIAQIRDLRTEVARLKPMVEQRDIIVYQEKRDAVILSFLPHASNTTKMEEKGWYKAAQQTNSGHLEDVLYGEIWYDLSPNERLAIEHLYYEDTALAGENTPFYAHLHQYIAAKRNGNAAQTKQQLENALWEILHNSPAEVRNALERDKGRHRRKAQATMLNSLNISTFRLRTPDYIVTSIKEHFASTPLERLLSDIVFPLKENARTIAEQIQRINADVQQQIFGRKSIVSDSQTTPEATDAFVELMTKIMHDVRPKIEEEIEKQAKQGKTEPEIVKHIKQSIEVYQDTIIPQKMDLLATHFNGKLTELEQREAGYAYYVWHSQDDPKVRPSHAANDGKIFAWDNPPPTGHPGEDYNCRCYAEPYRLSAEGIDDPPIEPVYFETLIPAFALRRIIFEGTKRIGKAMGKVFRDPISKRPKGVPKDWKKERTDDGRGYIYKDPKSKGHAYVKTSKGDPKNSQPGKTYDNVRWQKDGKSLDKNGNVVPKKSQESHIPIEDFKFDPRKFK